VSRSTPTISDVVARLMAVKLIVRGTADAMPSLAREMRREACESIDDIIQDLAPYEKGVRR
jgi:hypothetical protein